MPEAFIVDAVRSPMGRGKSGGSLSSLHAVELLAQTITGLLARHTTLDPARADDVLIGCVSQGGEQAATPGRMAWLAAGLPPTVPATTIDRRCGSGLQAMMFAAHAVQAGAYDLVIAGGLESMSRVPMGSARMGQDVYGPSVTTRYAPGLVSQGIAAELVASKWGLDRETLDAYAAGSHERAAAAEAAGRFDGQIVPITVPGREEPVDRDETIRPGTTLEKLAGLKPAFRNDADSARFPEINWHITAGNSSQITDGASVVLIASERAVREIGLTPRARFHAESVVGDDPIMMLTGPIPATELALERAGMRVDQLDHIEVNEAFAPVPLAWASEFPGGRDALNPDGGAIALGHPLGASGARLFTSLLAGLESRGGRYGLLTICEAGGMANATIFERI
ncbi:MAG TPA: thiolase family protein [Candidatus Limnocylindria bacterium]|nr:thiolase family protein [Candidatus Limnocylindria bacterium]